MHPRENSSSVCVCIYVCIQYVCMYVFMYACVHVCMDVSMNACIYIYIYMCMYIYRVTALDTVLKQIYSLYSDYVLKNAFYEVKFLKSHHTTKYLYVTPIQMTCKNFHVLHMPIQCQNSQKVSRIVISYRNSIAS